MYSEYSISKNCRGIKVSVLLLAIISLVLFSLSADTVFAEDADNSAGVIELYQGNADANENFYCVNMLPGDTVSQNYSVKVFHNRDITLRFNETITDETKNLGGVLKIKVINSDTGDIICDSTFGELNGTEFSETLTASSDGFTVVNYQITASVDTSVGNEYQAASLTADFKWYVDAEDQGGLTVPQTGEKPMTAVWIILGAACVVLLISVLIRRGKGDRENG